MLKKLEKQTLRAAVTENKDWQPPDYFEADMRRKCLAVRVINRGNT